MSMQFLDGLNVYFDDGIEEEKNKEEYNLKFK